MTEDEHRDFDRKLAAPSGRVVKNTNVGALMSLALLEEE